MRSAQRILLKEVCFTKKGYGHRIKVLNSFMEQIMNRELTDLDLTAAQGRIIGYLAHSKEVPCARDLEEFFDLSHPTVSGLLSRMEDKGFIRLASDQRDRRIKRIYLLEKGEACSKRIRECIWENEACFLQGFSPEEAELFLEFLQKAVENLGAKAQRNQANREE